MSTSMSNERNNPLRLAVWGSAAALLLLPLVAMQFTSEVQWTVGDFVVFGVMLLVACGGYEVAARLSGNKAYRLGAGLTLLGGFLLAWLIGAVGVIGVDGDRADLMYLAVYIVGVVGAMIARFKPLGLSRTLTAMATVQAFIAVIALLAGYHEAEYSSVGEILLLNGFFVVLFLTAAWLFWRAQDHGASHE